MRELWGRANSINVMKALWCLDELGLEYERRDAGMAFGVVDTPEYRAMNPNGRVPTLRDGDLVLWESNAIVRYLCERYSPGDLSPADAGERAVADQWMDWQQTSLLADVTFIFWGLVRGKKENQDPALIKAASGRLGDLWTMLDEHLAQHDYVAGARFTMGDIPLGTFVWRWANLDIERPRLEHVAAWHERLKQRSAFGEHVMVPLT